MIFHSHANKTRFHKKGCALGLILKLRVFWNSNQNVSIDVMVNLSRFQGRVYINGVGLGQVQDWYACKIGYVLQLAVPYYEELTVRQNLFFAAHMRLPKGTCISYKYERVEQIIAEVSVFGISLDLAFFTKTIMRLLYPPKFCLTIVFYFSWDDCNTQEKLETMFTQFFWGGEEGEGRKIIRKSTDHR